MNINDAVRTAHRILRSFRTKGSNHVLLRSQIKRGAHGHAIGLVPADGQGLIRFAHPVGAPSLRFGVCVTAFLSNEGFESNPASQPNKKGCSDEHPFLFGGEAGIRTLGGLQTLNGFQDHRIRPLCHLS